MAGADSIARKFQHDNSEPIDISIANGGTESVSFVLGGKCINSLYYAEPTVTSFLKAESKESTDGTWRPVRFADGTEWQYPNDGSNIAVAAGNDGAIGLAAFNEFVGLQEVKFVAQDAQTTGWTLKVKPVS